MANKNDRKLIKDERAEDVTMYGEFVSSLHQWRTPDNQRKAARHLEEATEELSPDEKSGLKSKKRRSNKS